MDSSCLVLSIALSDRENRSDHGTAAGALGSLNATVMRHTDYLGSAFLISKFMK